jgi:hypothetical protein
MRPSNPRLQRTPSASPPSPLSRQPLGGRRRRFGILALLSGLATLAGCALALPASNEPFDEKIRVVSPSPAAFQIHIDGADVPPVQVPADGRAIVHIPVLPRECSTYLFGIKLKDRSVEARKVIEFVRDGRVVEKISVNYLRRQPADSSGFHALDLK